MGCRWLNGTPANCLSVCPWSSLIALVICWAGTGLFCGTGHEALTLFLNLLKDAAIPGFKPSDVDYVFQAFQYAMFGIAPFMFVVSVLFLIDGVIATRVVKMEIEFTCRTGKCGIATNVIYWILGYVLAIAWLLMSALAALPIYFFQVSNSQCNLLESDVLPASEQAKVCVDFVQTGIMQVKPGSTEENYGRLCGNDLKTYCTAETDQTNYELTYQMFLIAFIGSCLVLLSMKHFLMCLSANYAYVNVSRKLSDYNDMKFKEEMELNDIIHTARSHDRLTYKY